MEHPIHSDEKDNTPIEESESVELLEVAMQADPIVSDTEADLVWRQFIHQELESLQNPEKVEWNPMPKEAALETSPPASLDQVLATVIEKIPVERMIDSAVRFLRQKTEPNRAETRSRRHRRK